MERTTSQPRTLTRDTAFYGEYVVPLATLATLATTTDAAATQSEPKSIMKTPKAPNQGPSKAVTVPSWAKKSVNFNLCVTRATYLSEAGTSIDFDPKYIRFHRIGRVHTREDVLSPITGLAKNWSFYSDNLDDEDRNEDGGDDEKTNDLDGGISSAQRIRTLQLLQPMRLSFEAPNDGGEGPDIVYEHSAQFEQLEEKDLLPYECAGRYHLNALLREKNRERSERKMKRSLSHFNKYMHTLFRYRLQAPGESPNNDIPATTEGTTVNNRIPLGMNDEIRSNPQPVPTTNSTSSLLRRCQTSYILIVPETDTMLIKRSWQPVPATRRK
jgi:hypothetical protein